MIKLKEAFRRAGLNLLDYVDSQPLEDAGRIPREE